MKKLTYIIYILFVIVIGLLTTCKAYANSNMVVIPLGSSFKAGNSINQNIAISSNAEKNWKLIALPLNKTLQNNSHPASQILISRITIEDTNNSNLYQLEYNKPIIITSGNDKIQKNFSLKLQASDADYPGNYDCNIQFRLISLSGTSVKNFTFSFTQPEIQNILITQNLFNINIDPKKLMLNNFSQESTTTSKIYIRSNKEWKLNLLANDPDKTLNYYFKVLFGLSNSKIYYSPDYMPLDNTLTIAKGNPTISPDGLDLDSVIIEVRYKLMTDKAFSLTAGSYPCNLVYSLS